MPLRLFTLTFAILLALIGIGAGIWAARQTPPFHTSGLHGIGFLFILPAPFLAALGVWVRLALGLARIGPSFGP